MSKILLAADIGGSKTRIQLLDTDGNLLSEFCDIGVASAIQQETPLPVLEKLLFKIPDKASVIAAAINLGGRNTKQVLQSFRIFFPDIPMKIFRESEGSVAYTLCEIYNASIVLMAGTGSIAVGRSKNGCVITGGWGINIGDGGSGYDIGLQAIRMALEELDGIEPLSPLTEFLCDCKEPLPATATPSAYRDRRDRIREALYPLDRQHIASLTQTVAIFAERADPCALKIFEEAGIKLAKLVINTSKKLEDSTSTIVVTGGLVHSKQFWAPPFEALLPNINIQYVADGLLEGTRYIAKQLCGTGEVNI